MGNYPVTRLIWQHMGGESGDRRPQRRLVVPCGFEGESQLGCWGGRKHLGGGIKQGLVRSAGEEKS